MKPEDIAAKACAESHAEHGIMGGSPYDCALRAARIALGILGPSAENRLLEQLKVNRGIFAMMSEQYTSHALHKIITEFEKSTEQQNSSAAPTSETTPVCETDGAAISERVGR